MQENVLGIMSPGEPKSPVTFRSIKLMGTRVTHVDSGGVERMLLHQEEHLLLLQGTQAQFPVPTWWLTTFCNSSSKGSDALF